MAEIDTFRFTDSEYETRLSRVRAAMEAKGIDTLITSDPSNMAWLTGYDGWSFYVHQSVIIGPTETRSGSGANRTPRARCAPSG
jgi:ectoine hydrolase